MTAGTSRPRLRNGVMLTLDPVRQTHMVLFDDGVITIDDATAAILKLCDGAASVPDIAQGGGLQLAKVTEILHLFADRRVIEWV